METAGDTASGNKFSCCALGGTLALYWNTPDDEPGIRNAAEPHETLEHKTSEAASRINASVVGGIGTGNNSLNGNFGQ